MEIRIVPGEVGQRLDKIVALRAGLGRARARELFAAASVALIGVDGRRRRARKGDRAEAGAVLLISDEPRNPRAEPDPSLPLAIALERADVVVVDKPAGIPSAPILPGERGAIANALVARYPEMAAIGFSPREPGLCHRLDTATSGLLLAARSAAAFERLTAGLKSGALDKRYLLVCELAPGADLAAEGEIDLPLAAAPGDPRRVIACRDPDQAALVKARAAHTSYRVLQTSGRRALCEARAARAFRHQIRVHLAAVFAPLCGDELYGEAGALPLGRHALHASLLSWPGDEVVPAFRVESPLPAELAALL